ncbi:hypothetical protein DPMN_132071 [Dreissena polymorpha]|uniref:Uncharacterized protein n=1 Tax=Dreissena polymorpha TaxID=45954 RepID=A0A9D4FV79_DREPO|nr:hypothetical protein DPMN_132071 [Dreissena polymorpha]
MQAHTYRYVDYSPVLLSAGTIKCEKNNRYNKEAISFAMQLVHRYCIDDKANSAVTEVYILEGPNSVGVRIPVTFVFVSYRES